MSAPVRIRVAPFRPGTRTRGWGYEAGMSDPKGAFAFAARVRVPRTNNTTRDRFDVNQQGGNRIGGCRIVGMAGVDILGGRYRLVKQLGAGGMSVVWRGYDQVLGRSVGVKVLAADLTANPASRRMIRAEAQAAGRLSHPHIARVYDYGESNTADGVAVPFIVMELVSGPSLEQRLTDGPLPIAEALRTCAEVAAALAAAHDRGLVHRDVKPSNVMLAASGAKVVDFGIARLAGEDGERHTMLGTPAYLAPERLAGGRVQPATDVYALGALLHRTLTGRLPWPGETTQQLIAAHVWSEPRPLTGVAGLPGGVADIYLRCLAKDPEDRPTSREVALVLGAAAGVTLPLTADDDAHPASGRVSVPVRPQFPVDADEPTDPPQVAGRAVGRAAVPRARTGRRRRRVAQVGAAVGGVAVILLLASWRSRPHGSSGGPQADVGTVATAPAPCAIRYVTRSDAAGQFDVDLTVTNNGNTVLDSWMVQFAFAGDQQLRGSTSGAWTQAIVGTVSWHGAAGTALPPHGSAAATFQGEYHSANPLPSAFTLNGLTCSYVAVDARGQTHTGGPTPSAPRQRAVTAGGGAAPDGGGSTAAGGPVAGGRYTGDAATWQLLVGGPAPQTTGGPAGDPTIVPVLGPPGVPVPSTSPTPDRSPVPPRPPGVPPPPTGSPGPPVPSPSQPPVVIVWPPTTAPPPPPPHTTPPPPVPVPPAPPPVTKPPAPPPPPTTKKPPSPRPSRWKPPATHTYTTPPATHTHTHTSPPAAPPQPSGHPSG